jgi:hypothetical protein
MVKSTIRLLAVLTELRLQPAFKTTAASAVSALRLPSNPSQLSTTRCITSQILPFLADATERIALLARNIGCEKSLFATGTYPEPTCPWFTPHSFTHSMELLALTCIYPSRPDDKYRSVHVVVKGTMPCQYTLRMLNSRLQQGTGLSIW